jgi:hypothetical protein
MWGVMTATPLDMHMHGQGMGSIGVTLSAHTLGMFALSPLTGRFLDSVGPPVMLGGPITLVVATILALGTSEPVRGTRTAAGNDPFQRGGSGARTG